MRYKENMAMKSVDDALRIILDSVKTMQGERVTIVDALNRFIFEEIVSDINIPSFDNSAMDGYAIFSPDTAGVSKDNPVRLQIIEEIQAGIYDKDSRLSPGTAIRIMTGGVIPGGGDTVIPVEDTVENDGYVFISKKIMAGENIRLAGEDISAGQKVLVKGKLLKSADIGLLASLNRGEVDVYKRPSVGVISTGDEVVDIGRDIEKGQVRNSNAYTLRSMVKENYAVPNYFGIARDDINETRSLFQRAMDESDILISTGGVSMGKYDFVRDVIRDLGIDIKIETIMMKPGKPFVFGVRGDKIFFGLPGNPVSTMISFIEFVRPALLKMMGALKTEKPVVLAVLDDEIKKKPGRRHFIRGHFYLKDGNFHVSTTGPQGSGILRSMSEANCLIILREEIVHVKPGGEVLIQLIGHGEI